MEFIRWVILQTEKDFIKTGVFIPCFLINVMLVGFLFAISIPLGATIATISVIIWGIYSYVFISREVKIFYEKYEREKANTRDK